MEAIQFLIVCPLALVAGFVDAVAGGGGLISLPAYLIAGLPVHTAIGTNKLSSGMGTAVATIQFARNGCILWKQAVFYMVCALAGSASGAKIALMISNDVFKIIMLVILPLTALYVTRGKALDNEKEPFSTRKTVIIGMCVSLGIGLYDGFYGPGTGTFLLLLLTSVARIDLRSANGTAKAINLTTNFTGLTVFLMSGKALILLGIIAGCFGIVGNYLGTRYFQKSGAKAVKPIMLIVLAIFFIRILTEL